MQRVVREDFHAELLSPTAIELLLVVGERPGIGMGRAAAELGVSMRSLAATVRKLALMGLLHREVDPDDRRLVRLTTTEVAAERLRRFGQVRSEALAPHLAALDAGDREVLRRAVELIAGVEQALAEDGRERTRRDLRGIFR